MLTRNLGNSPASGLSDYIYPLPCPNKLIHIMLTRNLGDPPLAYLLIYTHYIVQQTHTPSHTLQLHTFPLISPNTHPSSHLSNHTHTHTLILSKHTHPSSHLSKHTHTHTHTYTHPLITCYVRIHHDGGLDYWRRVLCHALYRHPWCGVPR